MRSLLFNRRRSDRFARLLETDAPIDRPAHRVGVVDVDDPEGAADLALAGDTGSDNELAHDTDRAHDTDLADDPELAGYLRLTSALRSVPHPRQATTEPSFRTSARAMLVAMAEREGIGVTATEPASAPAAPVPSRESVSPPLIRSRRVRGAIVVGLASGVIALSGMSIASGDAMPGDTLYGVKGATENFRLAIAGSDVSRGQLLLGFARERADEARTGAPDPDVLDNMDSETSQGVKLLTGWVADHRDPATLAVIDRFVTEQRAALKPLLAGPLASRIRRSVSLLDLVSKRSADLRATLACGAPTGRRDPLGPLPGTCPR